MLMIVKNNLLNFKDAYIYQYTDYFKFSLDSLLLANFVTINLRDKNILDIATGNAPIPMLLSIGQRLIFMVLRYKNLFLIWELNLLLKIRWTSR